MLPHSLSAVLLLLFALASPCPASQVGGAPGAPSKRHKLYKSISKIEGTVVDLSRDAAGGLLYCTAEGEVGRLTVGGLRTVLATAASGPFPDPLRALAQTPAGDIAVLDREGRVRVLPGGATPAVLVYNDLYMIQDATDLIVDARGSFLIASATPSNGQRAVNWISSDGARWAYYLVKHQPLQLAHDPLTGGIVISELTGGGNLQLAQAGSVIHATVGLDTTTHPGISIAQDDGDVAAEADGDLYWIAGGTVYKFSRTSGTSAVHAAGFAPLHGVTIGRSTITPPQSSGWSLYVAEGANPTTVRELPGVEAPGAVIASDQGSVPGRGKKVNVNFGFQVYELAVDNAGNLLVGGTLWGSTQFIKRVTLTGTPSIAPLASSADGLLAPVEGLCVAPDDSIYACGRTGVIQRITEGPLTIQTVFSDPTNAVTAAKDLALDVDGSLYIASREAWNVGKILEVDGGVASLLSMTQESRGLAANPAGGMFVSQWHGTGFEGTVDLFHFSGNWIEGLPGFAGMNYTNGFEWGDGDLCVDANGSVYTISEDDWSLVRYDATLLGLERIGSGYLNRPSGVAIAPSTAGSGSTTGWSLYASEFDNLWEIASVPPPAPTLVNAALGVGLGRRAAGTPHPRYGRPHSIAPGRRPGSLWIRTELGWLLELETDSAGIRALHQGARPQGPSSRVARLPDPLGDRDTWWAIDGWVIWRIER